MSVQRKPYISPQEYLELERAAETKSEYFNGEIFAMAGTSESHGTIVFNLAGELRTQLKAKPCRGYLSDMRVRIRDFGIDKYTYPDMVIVCGEREFEDDSLETLVNPNVIIEVLSKSTEAYDRGAKFAHYRHIPSFREYVLVSQSAPYVEHYVRQEDDRWLMTEISGIDQTLRLDAIGAQIALSELYYDVDFSQSPGLKQSSPE